MLEAEAGRSQRGTPKGTGEPRGTGLELKALGQTHISVCIDIAEMLLFFALLGLQGDRDEEQRRGGEASNPHESPETYKILTFSPALCPQPVGKDS